MKNVKKLLKKAMVFTVAASMLVGTPLTASAAGIRDVYSIQDGSGSDEEKESGTGTVSNTDTGSGVLVDNDAKIIGIVLDKENVNAEKGKKGQFLKATIVLDGEIYKKDENGKEVNVTEEVRKKLASKIRWELSFADGSKDENPAATVGIKSPTDENGKIIDKTIAEVNPKKGTKKGKEVVVTASINSSYWFDEDGNAHEYERPVGTYEASAKVFVKEYSTGLEFKDVPTLYVKHTLDLNDYLVRTPSTANDDITWITTDAKIATVNAAGVATFKKEGSCLIYAVGERGAKTWLSVDVKAGVQSSRIEIVDASTDAPFKNGKGQTNKADADLGLGEWNEDAEVVMYAKVKGAIVSSTDSKKAATSLDDAKMNAAGTKYVTGNVEVKNGDVYYLVDGDEAKLQDAIEITDTVTWTSNKPAIVGVAGDDNTAVLTAKGVGTAVVTAKASSGKTAKVTIAVKATLTGLEITNTEDELYSGQSLQMTFDRTPAENKDGVKWSIKKVKYMKNGVEKEKPHPNATINSKGLLKIKPKLDLSETGTDDSYQVVTVVLESKTTKKDEDGKKVPVASDEYDIVISQSSIDKITVTDDAGATVAEVFTEYKDNGNASVKQSLKSSDKANTTYISVPKDRTYTAVVEASKGLDYEAGTETLTWTTSNAKVASISYTADGKAKITANANGKATITVSGIRAVNKPDGSIKSASVIKTTFKVDVKQPVKTVTLNKPSVVLNEKRQKKSGVEVIADQKVALKATLGPKGVKKEAVYWSVKENGTELTDLKALGLMDNSGKLKTAANVSVNLPAPAIGDVFEITARTESGAYAVSTVKIVQKTTSVAIAQKELGADKTPVLFSEKNKQGKDVLNIKNAGIGETFKMYPCINVGKDAKTNVDYYTAGTENCEDVTYSVNKKGIVTIDDDGTVHAINKGTVKITAKTPLGKKATLTVNVSLPQG